MAYGDKRDYRPIQIYIRDDRGNWSYWATTTWSATCKEAEEEFLKQNPRFLKNDIHTIFKH